MNGHSAAVHQIDLGSRWLHLLLGATADKARLARGKTYFAQGAARSLTVTGDGTAAAMVGGRVEPYHVEIRWPSVPVDIRIELLRSGSGLQAIAADRLLDAMPQQWEDMQCFCSCPDWAVPCKHLIALAMELARSVSHDPELLFSLWEIHRPAPEPEEEAPEELEPKPDHRAPALPAADTSAPAWAVYLLNMAGQDHAARRSAQKLLMAAQRAAAASAKPAKAIDVPAQAMRLHRGTRGWSLELSGDPGDLSPYAYGRSPRWFVPVPELAAHAWEASAENGRDHFLQELLRFVRWLIAAGEYRPCYVERQGHGRVFFLPSIHLDGRRVFRYLRDIFPTRLLGDNSTAENSRVDNVVAGLIDTLIRSWLWKHSDVYTSGRSLLGPILSDQPQPHNPQLSQRLAAADLAAAGGSLALRIDDWGGTFCVQAGLIREELPFLPPWRWQNDVFAGPSESPLLGLLDSFLQNHSLLQDCLQREARQTELDGSELAALLSRPLQNPWGSPIKLLLPKGMDALQTPRLKARAQPASEQGSLTWDSLMEFSWQAAIGDRNLTEQEFSELLQWGEGIVRFQDSYVQLRPEQIDTLRRKLAEPSRAEPVRRGLRPLLEEEYDGISLEIDKRVETVLASLQNTEKAPVPKGLAAELRPYQLRGYQWLTEQTRCGFGVCLADDMGLGKTVQAAAWIQRQKETEPGRQPILIVCPTTLLANWAKELRRFTPDLKVLLYYGPRRSLEMGDVVITSYGVVRRDEALQQQSWHAVILDEAQNIKNPRTAQSKAVKSLSTQHRIALTGTPIENGLMELWSIFDFLNPGYLPHETEFRERTVRPAEKWGESEPVEKLKRAVDPFLLRRLKSDPAILPDLPDKLSSDEYVYLQPEQAALYKSALSRFSVDDLPEGGIERSRMVLAILTQLKQICNHPAQFLKTGRADPRRSGKALRLLELLRQIQQQNERALVFTQYRQMGILLQEMLEEHLGWQPLFFHGGLPAKARSEMADAFQAGQAPAMILSLKAGGSGLNLTAANHVIHYDLWWNPAVENQATDRAHRIGQEQRVMVHRFITMHSFEERIDELVKAKQTMADQIITAGEHWPTRLDNDELRELLRAGRL